MKRFIIGFLFTLALPAWACSCAQQTLPEAFQSASAVFVAKVVSVEKDHTGLWNLAQVEISRAFKGTISGARSVRTASSGASCGYGFQTGETYLIWASETQGQLSTSLCSLTKPTSQAQDAIAWLGGGAH